MAFGLDDLQNLVDGLRRTFKGSSEPTRVQQNIRQGVVNPLRMGAELSGVNQAYRGVQPDASNMDRGLALLAMAGMLGGQQAASGVKNVLSPKYAYGIHINPSESVGRLIKPINDVETRYGLKATPGYNAFFGFGNKPEDIPDRALESALKWAIGNYKGSASIVKTPQRKITRDVRSPVGYKTPKNLKVVKTMPYEMSSLSPDWEYMSEGVDSLEELKALAKEMNVLDREKLKNFIRNKKATP
jgi:hypothetical protein